MHFKVRLLADLILLLKSSYRCKSWDKEPNFCTDHRKHSQQKVCRGHIHDYKQVYICPDIYFVPVENSDRV